MNEILKIIETRNLYAHLILFKIYLASKGRTDRGYSGNLRKDIQELFGENFKQEDFLIAEQYLNSKGYLFQENYMFSDYGRDYFEDWIKNFLEIENKDIEVLESKLPGKIFNFFGIVEKGRSVLGFLNNLKELTME
ncbi:hypothetical protein QYR09_07135 [Cellulophaga lytica]|nr:hypothetical protein QYR09_07135 [Cellulophaga lytica]